MLNHVNCKLWFCFILTFKNTNIDNLSLEWSGFDNLHKALVNTWWILTFGKCFSGLLQTHGLVVEEVEPYTRLEVPLISLHWTVRAILLFIEIWGPRELGGVLLSLRDSGPRQVWKGEQVFGLQQPFACKQTCRELSIFHTSIWKK